MQINSTRSLLVVETHPIQYHVPVYRMLNQKFNIPVTVVYGSDFSVAGYRDPEFGVTFAWDIDLLSGYSSVFLSRVSEGGAKSLNEVSTRGLNIVLRKINPSAALLVGYSPRFHQEAFLAVWRRRIPILFRGETIDHVQNLNFPYRWIRNCLLKWFYHKCAKILYIGKRSLEHYRRLGCPENKLIFSPYCVDTSYFRIDEKDHIVFRNRLRNHLALSHDHRVLLFSGKLIPKKAPDLILRAVQQLSLDIRKRLAIFFLGEGELRHALQELARSIPEIVVHFLGFRNQTELSPYYHAADVLVLPSNREPWGLVVNEALHHGLPCVVSDQVGCAPDLVEPGVTGEVFRAGSAQSLALALERVMRLVESPKTRKNCQSKVAHYTVERAAQGIAQAYWSIMQKKTWTTANACS
ncbi:MAG: glycosyltransferase family 4 protein [Bacteroidetes bacterium]|nr:glycosyltransferase family 4 protein [Bacteroidota bacterium]